MNLLVEFNPKSDCRPKRHRARQIIARGAVNNTFQKGSVQQEMQCAENARRKDIFKLFVELQRSEEFMM